MASSLGHLGISERSRVPNWAETQRMVTEYQRTGELAFRDEAFHCCKSLVYHVARRFTRTGEPLEDLVQVGSIGLLSAIDRFDVDRGVGFSTFATVYIRGSIQRYLRDQCRRIRVPRLLTDIAAATNRLENESVSRGNEPSSAAEMAERLGVSQARLCEAEAAFHAQWMASLDAPRAEGTPFEFPDEEKGFAQVEARDTVAALMSKLNEREQRIVDLYYFASKTVPEISRIIGCSRNYVFILLHRCRNKMRAAAERSSTPAMPA